MPEIITDAHETWRQDWCLATRAAEEDVHLQQTFFKPHCKLNELFIPIYSYFLTHLLYLKKIKMYVQSRAEPVIFPSIPGVLPHEFPKNSQLTLSELKKLLIRKFLRFFFQGNECEDA